MAKIARYRRHRNTNKMGGVLRMEGKIHSRENVLRESDADDIDLYQSTQVDHRETEIFFGFFSSGVRENEYSRKHPGRGHADEIGEYYGPAVAHEKVEDIAAEDVDERRYPASHQEAQERRIETAQGGESDHITRSAIMLAYRALSEMPRSSG